jgi:hypothetical protein
MVFEASIDFEPRYDEEGGQPGAQQAGEEEPGAAQSHEKADAAQSDRKPASHVGGHHGKAHRERRDPPSADIIILFRGVAPEVIPSDPQDAAMYRLKIR